MPEFEDAIQDETIETPPPPERETFTHVIEVTLNADEQLALKDQLVSVDRRIIDVENEKASEMSGYNETLKTLRKERVTTLDAIASGKGRREIDCYEERDDRLGRMLIRRVDTDEVIDERPLSLEERDSDAPPPADPRQADLFDDDTSEPLGGGDPLADDESEGGRIVRTTSAEARTKAEERTAQEGDAQA